MVKNEEKIITRCIERAIECGIIDAILIYDTGSCDKTVEIASSLAAHISIPSHLVQQTNWKNFGFNRSLSFDHCVDFCKTLNWPMETTYALVMDADMILCTELNDSDDINVIDIKQLFSAPGYTIEQRSGSLIYRNSRFLQLSTPWKCLGVTHEYWDGAQCSFTNLCYIEDVGDGGCKDDKFERDERLLSQGILDEPNNVRYMFYLAQTLQNLKRFPEAIAMYRKRVKAGGWYQEQWYSAYQLCRIFKELGNYAKMEYWGLRASGIDNERVENLCFLTQVFRERSSHFKAWEYMKKGIAIPTPTSDKLFLDNSLYNKGLLYEKTILNYYVQPLQRKENLRDLINYCNKYDDIAYSNLLHYVDAIPILWQKELRFPTEIIENEKYIASSTSFRRTKYGYLLNVRYVNYTIRPDGSYDIGNTGKVNTRNICYVSRTCFESMKKISEMVTVESKFKESSYITGIEDIRLTPEGQTFTGTSMEYNSNNYIQQVIGNYFQDLQELTNSNEELQELNILTDIREIKSPTGSPCEKNWVYMNDGNYVYQWHPLQIGKIINAELLIDSSKTKKTPNIFKHVRGSSNAVFHDEFFYFIVHLVQYTSPRKYYHMVVRFDKLMDKFEWTDPFYFMNNAIEYVLSITIDQLQLITIVSQNDANPVALAIDLNNLKFITQ
jgi:glycosyltransferase involved in cell wall biosynthesis